MEEDSDMGEMEEDRDMGGRGGRWRKTAIWGERREMEEDSDMGRGGRWRKTAIWGERREMEEDSDMGGEEGDGGRQRYGGRGGRP